MKELKTLIRKELVDFSPYVPGEQPPLTQNTIKLNTNENPYPPSPKIETALLDVVKNGVLRKYPNYHAEGLQTAIADEYHLDPKQILVTNGSDEAIRLLFQALISQGDVVVAPEPTYSYYPVLCEQVMMGANYIAVPVKENLELDIDALLKEQGKLLCFANPNAPTGILESKENLIKLISNFQGIVLSDEAYIDFAGENKSLIPEIKNHPNLVVTRTFSKSYALAGLRVGYLVGNIELINWIRKLKDSYNVGILDQVVALTSFLDKDYFIEKRNLVIEERESLKKELEKIGYFVPNSRANFLFCKPKVGQSPETIYKTLKEQNIHIRYFGTGISKNFIRITIGTKEENKVLLEALKKIG
ncbi:histidinol-phosphate transaminase [Leptospira sp. 96542]|nr:histidinol-phosphate transaminase [Leptospira sp. 96542]